MVGPPRPFLSPFFGTVQTLIFFRNIAAQDPVTKEWRTNFWPYLQLKADVQPRDPSKVLSTKLQETYAKIYDLLIVGAPDIRHNDRVVIDGAECIVESVSPWGGHLEVIAGARQPGTF